jgi:hypothetical protein
VSHGPILEDDLDGPLPEGYHPWPDWDTWAEFYANIRTELSELLPPLQWERSTAEALFRAWEWGEDLDALREELGAAQRVLDPRRLLDAS